jgi:hypothetical protein
VTARPSRPTVFALLLPFLIVGGGSETSGQGSPGLLDLTVRDQSGTLIAATMLAEGAGLSLRYRNSLYGSLAEEQFRAAPNGLHLVGLGADERAVLEEYYVIAGPARRTGHAGGRTWVARPRDALVVNRLHVAATDLGERTLLLEGHPPVELWRSVEDDEPTVIITLEPAG